MQWSFCKRTGVNIKNSAFSKQFQSLFFSNTMTAACIYRSGRANGPQPARDKDLVRPARPRQKWHTICDVCMTSLQGSICHKIYRLSTVLAPKSSRKNQVLGVYGSRLHSQRLHGCFDTKCTSDGMAGSFSGSRRDGRLRKQSEGNRCGVGDADGHVPLLQQLRMVG